MSSQILCPYCHKTLSIKKKERYCYDPIMYVDEILYQCSQCEYEKKVEVLGELKMIRYNKI